MTNNHPIVTEPRVDIDPRLEDPNIFAYKFQCLDEDEWAAVLIRSIDQEVIDGVEFPRFPTPQLQSQVHGHYGAHSILEAASFYKYVCNLGLAGRAASWHASGNFLDFGAGWGRVTRLFMRDFPLRNIVAYEPSNRYCSLARSLNPFINFLSGGYLPDGLLPVSHFDLVVSWSVFSHLSLKSVQAWLTELERISRPGAAIVCTTWGRRFLERLQEEKRLLGDGRDIHWYSKLCIDSCGNLESLIESYDKGEFVWFTGGKSDLYGEAFIHEAALESILSLCAPRLKLQSFDTHSLAQDVFVLRRI